MQGELVIATGKWPIVSCLRVSPTAMHLRAGPSLTGPTPAAKGRTAPGHRLPRRSVNDRPATAVGTSQAAGFDKPQPHRGVSMFESAPCGGRGCRRAGPPPKAGPAQAAVDSAAADREIARSLGPIPHLHAPDASPDHPKILRTFVGGTTKYGQTVRRRAPDHYGVKDQTHFRVPLRYQGSSP